MPLILVRLIFQQAFDLKVTGNLLIEYMTLCGQFTMPFLKVSGRGIYCFSLFDLMNQISAEKESSKFT
jgi:hypothetical protein